MTQLKWCFLLLVSLLLQSLRWLSQFSSWKMLSFEASPGCHRAFSGLAIAERAVLYYFVLLEGKTKKWRWCKYTCDASGTLNYVTDKLTSSNLSNKENEHYIFEQWRKKKYAPYIVNDTMLFVTDIHPCKHSHIVNYVFFVIIDLTGTFVGLILISWYNIVRVHTWFTWIFQNQIMSVIFPFDFII